MVRTCVGIYARGSDDSIDVENQLGPLREFCAARDFVVTEYIEHETGDDTRAKRPVFARLWEDARRGKVRVVIVVGLDRLTRRVSRLLELFADADRWKVRIISLRERESWTDMDARVRDFVLHGLGLAAEWELENLRDRTRKGLARVRPATPGGAWRTRTGKPIGRPRASQLLLAGAARRVQSGESIRAAAQAGGVSEASLRRYLKRLAGPRNDEGPGGAPSATPEPSTAS